MRNMPRKMHAAEARKRGRPGLESQLLSGAQTSEIVKQAHGEDQCRRDYERENGRLKNRAKFRAGMQLRTAPELVCRNSQGHGVREHYTDAAEAWNGAKVCLPAAVW